MKKIYFYLICLFSSLIILGCYDPVFSNIRKEVALSAATVTGSVNSITRYFDGTDEYLVTQNGKSVFYKKINVERTGNKSAWTIRANKTFKSTSYNYFSANYSGEYIVKLATDDKYIYIVTAVTKVDHDNGQAVISGAKIYYTDSLDGDTWEPITFEMTVINPDTNSAGVMGTILYTNAISPAGRKAYLRNESDVYQLNGGAEPTKLDKTALKIKDLSQQTEDAKKAAIVKSVAYFNGEPYFFTTAASITNETAVTPATKLYYGNSDGIHYSSDGENFELSSIKLGTVSCMTLTKDYLLFGQGNPKDSSYAGGGIYRVALDNDGVPGTSTVPFSTNADAAFTSSYQLVTLLSVDPSKEESESIMYASTNFKSSGSSISVSYDNLGLWAYYPSRGNWNRE